MEMFGVLDSCPTLYQEMLRYWLMWRFPEIVKCIQGASGLKFHLCGTYQGLLENFLRLFLLPDFLVVSQCGPVLRYEMLQYEHPLGQHWPNTDGTPPGLGVIGAKPDRPVVDGVVKFAEEWIRPLAPSGSVLLTPFTTMLAPPTPTLSPAIVDELINQAVSSSSTAGLPGKELAERAQDIVRGLHPGESTPLESPEEIARDATAFDAAKMEQGFGRYTWPNTPISQPDPLWAPADILAFEFLIAQRLGAMMVVAGDWCDDVPTPAHELSLKIPYVGRYSPSDTHECD